MNMCAKQLDHGRVSCNAGLQPSKVAILLSSELIVWTVLNNFALMNDNDTVALLDR